MVPFKTVNAAINNNLTVVNTISTNSHATSLQWHSAYTSVNSNSATWNAGGVVVDTQVRNLTGNWQSTYTTVQNNSATWNASGFALLTAQNFNASAGLRYLPNTLSNTVTAILPTNPNIGTIIYFEDPFNYWNTTNFVVSSNNKIGGRFETLNCNISRGVFYLTFVSVATGWNVTVL